MFSFNAGPKIMFGDNALKGLCGIPQGNVLIVADPFLVSSGLIEVVTKRLNTQVNPCTVFSEVEPDPTIESVVSGIKMLISAKPRVIVALGGGSAIDVAKAMLYFYLSLVASLVDAASMSRPYFIAIPTTSGTGSEVTSYSVIIDRQQNRKIPLSDPYMVPDVAILDDEFLKTLPRHIIAFTGMDVLAHAIEAYVAKGATAYTDIYAVQALHGAFEHLPLLYQDTGSPAVRKEMLQASCMAGIAFSNAGLGLNHALAHTIGAEFHIAHGKANALIMPYVIAFNAGIGRYAQKTNASARYGVLAQQLHEKNPCFNASAEGLIAAIVKLNETFEIPSSLKAEGVGAREFSENLDTYVAKILEDHCLATNPLEVNARDIQGLLLDIYEGAAVL